ncbi:spore germination protein GerPC [Desmospora profundinema]|uniref:RNase H-like nuclease (RuvC/YqgF family) n=1 Tax=Desmospora profundinema TaxID=1571184 RepID=A0ABU1IT47_9BACL|nr:spore germination protein GerPC [Desmospora profundinema]MDR6227613.1 putative RNase H-like nuclease (RuvC/YqgF family) [Desmospora profundinema]
MIVAHLWDRLNRMEQEMERLRQENIELRKQIESLQPISIERLEYKIQELSIQTLSGTLNIGLTTHSDGQGLEKWIESMHRDGKANMELGELKPGDALPIEDESSPQTDGSKGDSNNLGGETPRKPSS